MLWYSCLLYTSIWQVLPLTPTGAANSPYQSPSVLAGNPDLIDLWDLERCGLLTWEELKALPHEENVEQVDFPAVRQARQPLLRLAARRMETTEDYLCFLQE